MAQLTQEFTRSTDSLNIAPRPLSRLTYRILSLNIITLAVLAMSFSYISQTRQNLISNEISNFDTESRLYAALLQRTPDLLLGKDKQKLDALLSEINIHEDQQVSLFLDRKSAISTVGIIPLRKTYAETRDADLNIAARGVAAVEDMLSVNFKLPAFPGSENLLSADVPKIEQTVDGLNIAAWSAPDGGLILSADIDLFVNAKKVATLQLVRRDMQIEESFASTRIDVVRFAIISLTLTISFSLYLAGLIGHPLRNLAKAAEAFRLSKGRGVEIPDLSGRDDEIGELSEAMRDMADALRKRLTAIESFAADVAHELKNPLTSMRSAVETLPRVKNEADRERLTAIIHHDLQRMDRLISDISQASRLDSELARDVLEPLDVRNILIPLIEARLSPEERAIGEGQGQIIKVGFAHPVLALGQAGRLAQVFDNLIANALSFSPESKFVTVTVEAHDDFAKIMVDDEGPGIPESRLEKIFDRFYSERPVSEGFGMHSGLGLSIARQIVGSHGGTIHAENRKNEEGRVIGARFIVKLRAPSL